PLPTEPGTAYCLHRTIAHRGLCRRRLAVPPRPHSSEAEHFFGKEEVLGPIPSVGWLNPRLVSRAKAQTLPARGCSQVSRPPQNTDVPLRRPLTKAGADGNGGLIHPWESSVLS